MGLFRIEDIYGLVSMVTKEVHTHGYNVLGGALSVSV